MEGIAAATAFVDKYYSDCLAALLFGSVARSEARPGSDLDILIVAAQELQFYRKSFRDFGWFIEAYVGSAKFNEEKLAQPRQSQNSSFLMSWVEGIILKDQDDFARRLQERAIAIFEQGPDKLTQAEIDQYRYVISDWLDDLVDATSYEETMFIAYDLMAKSAELLLAINREWSGERKWLNRALLKSTDPLAGKLTEGLAHFYRTTEKDRLVEAVAGILERVGGRLYEGYSRVG